MDLWAPRLGSSGMENFAMGWAGVEALEKVYHSNAKLLITPPHA